jgi:hypothetical protein
MQRNAEERREEGIATNNAKITKSYPDGAEGKKMGATDKEQARS